MFIKNQEGHVLVTSLIILLVLIIVVTSMAFLMTSETSFLREKGSIKALYTAEAGLEYACNIISDNSKWNSVNDPAELKQSELDKVNNEINGGNLAYLTRQQSGNLITIVSKANSSGIEKTIKNIFILYSKSFDYSFVANGEINMVNNATVTGNDEGGDIYANDIISYKNNFVTNRQLFENMPKDIIPIIDFDYLKSQANIYLETDANNMDLSTIGNQITYVEGDLTIDNNTTINGNGILVIEGKLTILNSLDINSSTDDFFLIFIKGEGVAEGEDVLYINSGNTTKIKGFVYSNGNVYFKNSPVLTGTIMSKGDLKFKNSLDFTFDDSYLETFDYWNVDVPIGASGTNKILELAGWLEI